MKQETLIDRYLCDICENTDASPNFLKKIAVNFNINNVAKYLVNFSENEIRQLDFNHKPSWPVTWAEYNLPIGFLTGDVLPIKTVGILRTADNENIYIYLFILLNNGTFMPVGYRGFKIDKSGKSLNGHVIGYNGEFIERWKGTKETAKIMIEFLTGILLVPFYMANSFIHCKKTEIIKGEINGKDNKRRFKNGKIPYFRFNIININPMITILKNEGQSNKTGLKKALHICRGHFVTYTEKAPLFGKNIGTYWKPIHFRGNKTEGIVFKDYQIGQIQPRESSRD